MSQVRKWGKRVLSGVRVFVIGLTAGHGLIKGVTTVASGGAPIDKLPREVLWAYTGVNSDDGSFNQAQALASGITIVGGLAAAWLIGIGIKHM